MANANEVAFIICSNNELYYNECVDYIERLYVPEGYTIDILCITGANSMPEAYNAAMESSNAKYKVYLHQDVFILHKYFIDDIITIFRENLDVGMLGLLGGINLPKNAVIWNSWNVGGVYASDFAKTFKIQCFQNPTERYTEVEAIDGMLLATQYDLNWRDDLALGWDFYDISQSLEFRRRGYRIVVPTQKKLWCFHDCGHSKLDNYDISRERILKEYTDYFQGEFISSYNPERKQVEKDAFLQLKCFVEMGRIEEVMAIKPQLCNAGVISNDLQHMVNICEIYEAEKNIAVNKESSFVDTIVWEDLVNKYIHIKFVLRKIENGIWENDAEELIGNMIDNKLTMAAVRIITERTCIDCQNTYEYLQSKFEERKQAEKIKKMLIQLVELGRWEELQAIILENDELLSSDVPEIKKIANLAEIYNLEGVESSACHSQLFYSKDWVLISEYYDDVVKILQNIEEKRELERVAILKNEIESEIISKEAILKISDCELEKSEYIFEHLLWDIDEQPLVSVILCVYNGEQFVAKTIESVLNQTYQNMEIIIVDDASTDMSRQIIDEFHDERIRRIWLEKNTHVCYACNTGLAKATGKYIAFIGHDDVWENNKIKKQVYFMEKHPDYVASISCANIIDEFDRSRNTEDFLFKRFKNSNMTREAWIRKLVNNGNYFCSPSACIRREVIEKVGYYRYALVQLQDYDLWLRLLNEGPLYIFSQKLINYRRFSQSAQNISNVSPETRNRDCHERQWILADYIEKLPDDMYVRVFGKEGNNSSSISHKEVECEKALLLKEIGNCFAEKRFIELYEDAECRDILEQKYGFGLKEFYKWNTVPMFFDTAALQQLNELKRKIQKHN